MRNPVAGVFFSLLIAVPVAAVDAAEVRLMSSVEVNGGEILLAEVAQIIGAPRRLKERLEDIFVADAPRNGPIRPEVRALPARLLADRDCRKTA